uniref:NAD-dependent epimerase/dehydratase domain-containing protein n=1 Tax=Aegilops tauschii subsp. strangulata TaxID=200361 RepID=A0A453SUU5_AEGTS
PSVKARRMLSAVEGKERLRVFRADMAEEGSFDDAIIGCATLFHVAASMDLHLSPDQHDAEERVRSQVLEPATRGTINVLRSCVRAGTVRRVVFTSSVSTLAAAGSEGSVVDESCLRDLGDVWATKPIGWVYILSKRLAEEAAFGFARENGLRLVSVVLPTVAGDPKLCALLASVHARFGCVPLAHVQDACDAHLFLADAPAAEGRFGDDLDGASPASQVSSKRLLDLGFRFGHDAGDILRDAVAQCVDHGFLEPPGGCD